MFTGIIEEIGTVKQVLVSNGAELCINAKTVLENTKIGDSISVNGVCLTVTKMENSSFFADIMPESLRRSNLCKLKAGDKVNLERAMPLNGRFGGHIVTGHIDGMGEICRIQKEQNATWVYISCKQEILNLIVEKGSIAIDGISLTVAKLDKNFFGVSIIPHTSNQTTLLSKKVGNFVNLENDLVGKYVQRLLGQNSTENKKNTEDLLKELYNNDF